MFTDDNEVEQKQDNFRIFFSSQLVVFRVELQLKLQEKIDISAIN